MNEGKIWTVVKPTVGVPLFLGAVVVSVLGLHYAILTHTTWFSAYWNGAAGRGGAVAEAPAITAPTTTMSAPAAATPSTSVPAPTTP
jgi:light-harvesting protein B-800-850 alpha chain